MGMMGKVERFVWIPIPSSEGTSFKGNDGKGLTVAVSGMV
jgi:hypothetical protein